MKAVLSMTESKVLQGLMRAATNGRRAGKRRGATLLEFALTVPFLLALLLGVVEFGWLIRNTNIIGNAAREGARSAAIGYTPDVIYDRAVAAGAPLLKGDANGDLTNGDVVIEASQDGLNFGQFPAYQDFPPDACPVEFRYAPKPRSKTDANRAKTDGVVLARNPSAARKPSAPSRQTMELISTEWIRSAPADGKNGVQLIPATAQPFHVVLVKKPTPVPTAAPTPTSTPTPIPVVPTPTPDPTPDATVPPPGATPTPPPSSGAGGVTCTNSVHTGWIVRVTVTYEHKALTGFFPFLRNRTISVSQIMRRE